MKSPCHDCGHHLSGGDKNAPRCQACRDREAYVEADAGEVMVFGLRTPDFSRGASKTYHNGIPGFLRGC